MTAILEVGNLSKTFEGATAVAGLSLKIPEGQTVGLIGPNGSGKTTLFNLVCGFLPTDAGTIRLREYEITGLAPYRIARMRVGRTFQDLRLLRKVPVLENVMLGFPHQPGEGAVRALAGWGASREERGNHQEAMGWLDLVGLSDKAGDLAEALSYGQQKLLTIVCCLAMGAELLMLDEPVAGIDPDMRERILGLLRQLKRRGKTVFLIEHDLDAVRTVCDSVIVLDEGRKIAEGTPDVVMRDPAVMEAYLT